MSVPYAQATSGEEARNEIRKLLQKFDCASVGFMDDFRAGTLMLAFEWRGRKVQLTASAQGWAAMYLKAHPFNNRRRCTEDEYRKKALDQGMIAVNSVLRDLVKGQITCVEAGMMPFDHVFLPHMVTASGETVAELVDRRGGQFLELPE